MLSFNHSISGFEFSSKDFATLLVCFFFTVYGILQSVKPAKYILSSTKNKSHKKILNGNRPKLDHWGTTYSMSCQKLRLHEEREIPQECNFAISKSWFKQANALDKSVVIMVPNTWQMSTALFHLSKSKKCCVLNPFQKLKFWKNISKKCRDFFTH